MGHEKKINERKNWKVEKKIKTAKRGGDDHIKTKGEREGTTGVAGKMLRL